MPRLTELRVVDCADLSGAFCGRVLVDLGARVFRVSVPSPTEVGPDARWFDAYYQRGKRLAADSDAERLLGDADVLITTGRPSELRCLGLVPADLVQRYPRLVVANISPFGLDGPRAEWLGGNLIAAATGGMLNVNGWPDEAPLQPLGLQAYHMAGVQAALGVLLALVARERNGVGQVVDVSLQESVVGALEHVTGLYRERGEVARRRGTLHWSGTFRSVETADREVLASHLGDWDVLRAWVLGEMPESGLADMRWSDREYRSEHAAEFFDLLSEWSRRHESREIVKQAQLCRLPFAPIWRLDEVVRHPQLVDRKFFDQAARLVRRELRGVARPLVAGSAENNGALAGLRVLDLTWVVAGPVCTRVLADRGAEVIKIEPPYSDPEQVRRGGLFGNLNRGKKSVVLDLQQEEGLRVLRALVARCDVLVENFSRRVLVNWGLGDDELLSLNPELRIVHMSGFGHSGPMCDGVSYGPTLQAQAGFTAHMRHENGRAAGLGYSYSDMASGYVAALAVVAAVAENRASVVDLAQLEVLTGLIGPSLLAAANGVPCADALANSSQEGPIAPHGVYRCADDSSATDDACDRWCAITAMDEEQWLRLAECIDLPWVKEARFASLAGRLEHRGDLDRLLEEWTRRREAARLVEELQSAGVACGGVADAVDLLVRDEHLRARGMWISVDAGSGDAVGLDASAVRLSGSPASVLRPGPLLGEHSDAVLRGLLGFSDERLAALRALGVLQ